MRIWGEFDFEKTFAHPGSWTILINKVSLLLCTNFRHVLVSNSAMASWIVGLKLSKVSEKIKTITIQTIYSRNKLITRTVSSYTLPEKLTFLWYPWNRLNAGDQNSLLVLVLYFISGKGWCKVSLPINTQRSREDHEGKTQVNFNTHLKTDPLRFSIKFVSYHVEGIGGK